MVAVDDQVKGLGQVAHAHETAASGSAHFAHSAHKFGNRYHHRGVVGLQSLYAHRKPLGIYLGFDGGFQLLRFVFR